MGRFILLVLILTSFCLGDSTEKIGIQFKGNVVFNSFEMGFWGVVTDKGEKLDGTIPKELQIEGLRVKGLYKRSEYSVSFHMWGTPVDFLEIKKELK